jgi:hypothetical protein
VVLANRRPAFPEGGMITRGMWRSSRGSEPNLTEITALSLPFLRDMTDSPHIEETGAGTGAARENDPRAAGFTDEQDRLFRSHFQHANHLADRGFEAASPAYQLGYAAGADPCNDGKCFEEVEEALENGWLNVRTAAGDWATVRAFAEEAFTMGRNHGRVVDMPSVDEEERPSFTDPLA